MKERFEVILAGSGGQGLIVSAIILGKTAIREEKNVIQTQSYSIASRGGLSTAELIIDTKEILFQQVERPDIIVTLTEGAFRKYEHYVSSGTLIIYDSTLLQERTGGNLRGYPFTGTADSLGYIGAANIIALGTLVALTGMVAVESAEMTIVEEFPSLLADINVRALHHGSALVAGGNGVLCWKR